jgi:hypothetical protein
MFGSNTIQPTSAEQSADDYAQLGELHIRPRFPIGPFLWIVGGLIIAGFIGLVVLNSYLKSGSRDLPNLVYAYFVAIAGLSGTIYYLPTLWAFLFGPRPFNIGLDGFRFGARTVTFGQIVGLQHDAGRPSTRVLLNDGSNIKLRWPVWHDSPLWVAVMEHRTYPHLLALARVQVRAGKRVTFGRKLALDRTSIQIGGRSLPIATITDFHFLDGSDNGDDYRKLKIRTVHKEYVIDERKIINPQVFTGLFRELADGS